MVDAGIGLLANVRRQVPSYDDAWAMWWCFSKNNTTAATSGRGAEQYLPPDAPFNPFPPGVAVRTSRNNHLGLGLWQLYQLVRHLHGWMWALSGSTQLIVSPECPDGVYSRSTLHWTGFAIEVIFPVVTTFVAPPAPADESIAKRFSI